MKISGKIPSGASQGPSRTATTSERLQEILREKQIRQADLARSTGIGRGAISNYVLGRYAPKSDVIQKLAASLNCSEAWLQGYDVPMERVTRSFGDDENPHELEVRDAFDTLGVDDQIYVKDWVNAFAKDPEKMKNSPNEQMLTEGEKAMIELFRRVPEDKQQLVLQMIRAALCTDK